MIKVENGTITYDGDMEEIIGDFKVAVAGMAELLADVLKASEINADAGTVVLRIAKNAVETYEVLNKEMAND